MTMLLTGATGKVGSRLISRLAAHGFRVSALVRDAQRAKALLGADVELIEGDLLDPDSLAAAVDGMETIIHCAAFFRGATAEQAHATNDLGTRQLADAAVAAGVRRFVFTSTGLVYGPAQGRLVDEDAPCAPVDAYPLSKLAAERMLLGIQGLDVQVLRLPFVYGDGDRHIEEIVPYARGFAPDQRMSIGHHEDIAQAVIRLLQTPEPRHRIYNVVDNHAPTLQQLFAAVGAAAPDGSQAGRGAASKLLLDGSRIRAELGFRPIYPRLQDAMDAGAL